MPEVNSNLQIQCSAEFETEGKDSLPRFRIRANTGQPMQVGGFGDPVIISMEGVKFRQSKIPIIADHADFTIDKRIGHTDSNLKESINGSQINVEGILSSTTQFAQEIAADLKNGFPFEASVGAIIVKGSFL